MNLEIWMAYFLAAGLILIIPGSTIILVISQAISHGKKSIIPLVVGVVLGDFTAMVFSLLGLGALLSVSAALFTVLKWIGAIYLIYMGINLWRSPPAVDALQTPGAKPDNGSLFQRSYLVTALNPKGIVFFVAFLPQFVNPLTPALPQLVILGATFLILAGINASLYAVFAGQLREYLQHTGIRKWFDRCGGTALIGAGMITAAMKRS